MSDFEDNDSKNIDSKVKSPRGLASQKTFKPRSSLQNIKLKKVKIITEEEEEKMPDGKAPKSTSGRGNQEFTTQYMKDLTHEECNLLGLDSLL